MYFYSGQEDDAVALVISPLLDLRLMVSHITFVVVPPGQVVSRPNPCNAQLQIPTHSSMIGRNKFEAKESETPYSLRFELVCHQTLD